MITFSLIESIEEYYVALEMEIIQLTEMMEDCALLDYSSGNPIKNPTSPFHHLVNDLAQSQSTDPGAVVRDKHRNDAYILEGYRAWQTHAQYEEYSIKGLLSGSLRSGLSRMNRLHSVALTSNTFHVNLSETVFMNMDTLHCEYSGSPLARSWHPLHARPQALNQHMDVGKIIEDHLDDLIYALNWPAPPIIDLSLLGDRNALAGPVFGGLSRATLQILEHSEACRRLESFSLRVDTPDDDSYTDPDALGVLPKLLQEMQNLKHLQLDLIWSPCIDGKYYKYKQIFSKACKWPQLESLSLCGLALENHEFVHLTRNQLPSLRRLEIGQIDLLSGTWEAAVEFLRSSVCIKQLSHPRGVFDLTHQNGHLFDGRRRSREIAGGFFEDTRAKRFSKRIAHYVVHGGRHPCLPLDREPSAAAGYLPALLLQDNGFPDPGSIARLRLLPIYY